MKPSQQDIKNEFSNGLPLFHHPLLHRPRFRREVHADQVKLALVRLEVAGILVVFDLPQGFLGGLVQLQLYNINVVFRLDGNIYAALDCSPTS